MDLNGPDSRKDAVPALVKYFNAAKDRGILQADRFPGRYVRFHDPYEKQ